MENLPTDFFVTSSAYTPTVYRDQYPSIDPTKPALAQTGKVVIITGASAGIGARGFAPAFAKAKPKAIVLVGRDLSKLRATEDALRKITTDVEYVSVPTQMSDAASVDSLYQVVKSKYGHADVLINNAGTFAPGGLIGQQDPDSWWSDFEVNIKGTFLMTRGFLALLGTERKGSVVTLSTGVASAVFPSLSSYSLSKLGGLRLAEYVAAEYPNVTSIAVQPGIVMTDMVTGMLSAVSHFSLLTMQNVIANKCSTNR